MSDRCLHDQAVHVTTLSTNEVVACICISCYEQLPANYITRQREHAERVAHCTHNEWIALPDLAVEPSDWWSICKYCGEQQQRGADTGAGVW